MATLSIKSVFKLNSGYEIPLLGFGLYQTPKEITESVTTIAFDAGYRHVDSAAVYNNEDGAGASIAKAVAAGIPRSDIFYTTKVPPKAMSYAGAKAQVEASLKEAGLDYIDLMLLHSPYGGSENRKGAWRALVEAVEAGQVRSIGVSNYGVQHLNELEQHMRELAVERGGGDKGGGVLSVGQYEIHPWLMRRDITEWLRARSVAIEAYSPLVRGKRWGEPKLKALASRHGVSEAQILLRWSLQQGFIPLPKSVTESRIRDNAKLYDFALSAEEVAELETDEYKPVCWDPTVSPLENPLGK